MRNVNAPFALFYPHKNRVLLNTSISIKNNKIKVIKRYCYRIINVEHLFQRIFLDISE